MKYSLPVKTSRIRPLDIHRDLLPVADLIEMCFSSTLDPDGREYLRHIRKAASDPAYLRWIPGAYERVSTPLYGYVWEQDYHIVGNLSLIPILKGGRWLYLIANVAVHPDYRRRGIARDLTMRALEHIREHHVGSAWLQVRDDNTAAYNLYCSVGFVERSRRTTWVSKMSPSPASVTGVRVTARRPEDWILQRLWLDDIYPPDVTWNLSFDSSHFTPSLVRRFFSWLTGETQYHWVAREEPSGRPLGFASWEPVRGYNEMLWVGVSREAEDRALSALLPTARISLPDRQRPFTVNYPYNRAVQAFIDSGFTVQNTLVWMEYGF